MRVRASGGRRREPQKAAPGEQAGARACGAKVHAGRGAVEASGGASPCVAGDAEACGAKSHAGRWRARVLVLGGDAHRGGAARGSRKPAARKATPDEGCLKPPADAFGVAPSARGAFGASSSACAGSRRRLSSRARSRSRKEKSGQVEGARQPRVVLLHSRRSASSGRKPMTSTRFRRPARL